MAQVRVLVLRSPGANCDEETAFAFERAGAVAERIHVHRVLEAPALLRYFQILCIPGGFSYGDDIAAGRILAHLLRCRLQQELLEFRDRDKLILGICNGFQVLLKTGLLLEPDPETGAARATLALNRHGRFLDRWVYVQLEKGCCKFVEEDAVVPLPIAHAEGNFVVAHPAVLDELSAAGRVVARYVDADGNPGDFPINPNGSTGNVAGICDSSGRVFALMPHPERHLTLCQHPQWTRRADSGRQDPAAARGAGFRIFANAVRYFA